MKRTGFIFLLQLLVFTLFAFNNSITLTIKINQIENSDGHILMVVSDSDGNTIKEITQIIIDNQCTITLGQLKAGNYAFKYFHDANENQELDTNLFGIPKEGYGFSNNAKSTFGPPAFEKTVFSLQNDTIHNCVITYF
ncbi:DUF2141 domain-containing protein [Carboxylicivirga sp. RSCT41]|uniref:DUF2141 domain-containing protein n=1 Tax=Carboxylicivirga agarovorans TaxID=3417570 RepID=UPI003D344CC4